MNQPERRVVTNEGDIAYVQAEYRAVQRLDPALPEPSYYDARGNAYVPQDYERQERDHARFVMRAREECRRLSFPRDYAWIEQAWGDYRHGLFGMCLRQATPENIVRKEWLIERIAALIEVPSDNPAWRLSLRIAVDELDALLRPFSEFDRAYFGGSVSRDRYVDAVRATFLST